MSVRFRIDLSYDGTDFAGWAAQPGQRTVEAELTAAVARRPPVPGTPGRLVVAGRTDAGVHARGQVVHVDVRPDTPGGDPPGDAPADPAEPPGGAGVWSPPPDPQRAVRAWNGILPADIRVRSVAVAPAGFDARFAALWRRYVYRLADGATPPDPLTRAWTTAHHRVLDVPAMAAAASRLPGRHDFAAFCKPKPGATTIRTLQHLDVTRGPDGLVAVDVRADAFCHSMVRALVGALLAVGDGRRPADWPERVRAARVRDPGAAVAPARGLVLEEVGYPPDDELAARVERTRAVRNPADINPAVRNPADINPADIDPTDVDAGDGSRR